MTLGRGVTPPSVYLEHTNTYRVVCFLFLFFLFFKTLMSPFLYRIFTNRDRYEPPNGLGRGGSAKTRREEVLRKVTGMTQLP